MRHEVRQAARSWYFDSAVKPTFQTGEYDEISFGHYDDDGGCLGEARIVFYRFSLTPGRNDLALQVQIFSDGFEVLASDVAAIFARFKGEAGSDSPSPEEVLTWFVNALGYVDATDEVGPYGKAKAR